MVAGGKMTVLCLNWDKVGLCCDPVVASVGCAWYNSERMLCLRSAVVVLLSALTSLELSADGCGVAACSSRHE